MYFVLIYHRTNSKNPCVFRLPAKTVRISSYLTMFERLLRILYMPVRCLFRSASVSGTLKIG